MFTHKELRQLMVYDKKTGEMIWLVNRGRNKTKAKFVGTNKDGYLVTSINKKPYYLHRLVWFYHYGYFPKMLDHIDGNKSNNLITNLRATDAKRNAHNTRNKYAGVTWWEKRKKWRAQIRHNYKKIHIGLYNTFEEAYQARRNKEIELGWSTLKDVEVM